MTGDPTPCEGQVLRGPLFSELMRVETVRQGNDGTWVLGLVGTQSELFHKVTLTVDDLRSVSFADTGFRYDGDGRLLRLGLQAHSLGIAYEFDPYFGLSISRVDLLPHRLEAVCDFLLKFPRVRLLLTEDRLVFVGPHGPDTKPTSGDCSCHLPYPGATPQRVL